MVLTIVFPFKGLGADPNRRVDEGETALHFAAGNGRIGVVLILLEAGAKTDPVASDGATPLLLAAKNEHAEVVALLLSRGARKDKRDGSFNTAEDYARQLGHQDVLRALGK